MISKYEIDCKTNLFFSLTMEMNMVVPLLILPSKYHQFFHQNILRSQLVDSLNAHDRDVRQQYIRLRSFQITFINTFL